MISKKSIEEVIQTAQIEDVVQDFVNLKRRGSNMIGLCPFHSEKTPSFVVSPAKNFFKCFGCGRSGDSVGFMIEHEQFSFPEAIRYLAQKYAIELEETQRTAEEIQADLERESLYILNEEVQKFYKKQLLDAQEGKAIGMTYFRERGFRMDTIDTFGLGYAPKSGVDLKQYLLKAGFKTESMSKAGLLNRKETDFFRERVIFPIHNLSGKVIAFAGRMIGNRPNSPKYINSPETEIYHKSKILYGIYQAKRSIKQHDRCLLVEGYTDVMMLAQHGIENVVATSGTALTDGQIGLIKRFTPNVTLLFDGDAAGLKAAERGVNLMLERDMNVLVVVLPEGEDPDSYLRKEGQTAFSQFIEEQAKDFILFKTRQMADAAAEDPIKKTAMLKELVQTLSLLTDAVKRSVYVQQCAQMFKVDEHVLVNEMNKSIKQRMWSKRKEQMDNISKEEQYAPDPEMPQYKSEQPAVQSDYYQERDIVRILLNHGHNIYDEDQDITLGEYILAQIRDVIDHFEHPVYSALIHEYAEQLSAGERPTLSHFTHHEELDIQRASIDLSSEAFQYSPNWENRWEISLQTQNMPDQNYVKDAYNSILRLKLKKIEVVIRENKQMILNAADEDERDRYLMVQHELVDTRNQIAKELKTTVL